MVSGDFTRSAAACEFACELAPAFAGEAAEPTSLGFVIEASKLLHLALNVKVFLEQFLAQLCVLTQFWVRLCGGQLILDLLRKACPAAHLLALERDHEMLAIDRLAIAHPGFHQDVLQLRVHPRISRSPRLKARGCKIRGLRQDALHPFPGRRVLE